MWNRKELKERGKLAFKANYWKCVLVALILGVLTAAASSSGRGKSDDGSSNSIRDIIMDAANTTGLSPFVLITAIAGIIGVGIIIVILIQVLIKNPLIVGCKNFYLQNSYAPAELSCITSVIKGNYGRIVAGMFVRSFLEALATCLFIIPGVILAYSYRMVPYILAEHDDMSTSDALKLSREMMKGHKWNTFVLDLSFIGWILLGAITFGIVAVFYTSPYMYATDAELYRAIK